MARSRLIRMVAPCACLEPFPRQALQRAAQISIVVIGDKNIRGRGVAQNRPKPCCRQLRSPRRGLEVTVKKAGRRRFDTISTGVMEAAGSPRLPDQTG